MEMAFMFSTISSVIAICRIVVLTLENRDLKEELRAQERYLDSLTSEKLHIRKMGKMMAKKMLYGSDDPKSEFTGLSAAYEKELASYNPILAELNDYMVDIESEFGIPPEKLKQKDSISGIDAMERK